MSDRSRKVPLTDLGEFVDAVADILNLLCNHALLQESCMLQVPIVVSLRRNCLAGVAGRGEARDYVRLHLVAPLGPAAALRTHVGSLLLFEGHSLHESKLSGGRVVQDSAEGLGLERARHTILEMSLEAFVFGKLLFLSLSEALLWIHHLSNSLHVRVQVLDTILVRRVNRVSIATSGSHTSLQLLIDLRKHIILIDSIFSHRNARLRWPPPDVLRSELSCAPWIPDNVLGWLSAVVPDLWRLNHWSTLALEGGS